MDFPIQPGLVQASNKEEISSMKGHEKTSGLLRVLIVGANSYIGTSLATWLARWPENYSMETLDVEDRSWREKSFSSFNVVFHVAGIVHKRKASKSEYYAVNCDLAIEVANRAKTDGVNQFIFMSSMAVYGVQDVMCKNNLISSDTGLDPKTLYGKSKLQAEIGISALQDDTFSVAILRPPMVYGFGCRGNYVLLRRFTLRFGMIPTIENKRSAICISNLCECVKQLMDRKERGVFCPQDPEYFNTSLAMSMIGDVHKRKTKRSRLMTGFIIVCAVFLPSVRKAFGNLGYARIGETWLNYHVKTFPAAVLEIENQWSKCDL